MLALAVFIGAALAMTVHLDKPLLGPHSFRQTTTAISAFYMIGEHTKFAHYITPILGKPWEIPMELPIYQWITARVSEISRMQLDSSGQIVSAFAWFLCIIPIWFLLRGLGLSRALLALASAVCLSSPLYLFWGRAFLIETTGLFFALCMSACVLEGFRQKNWRWLAAGLVFGILAALCKITTWAVACGVTGLLLLFSRGLPNRRDFLWLAAAGIVALLPIVPGKLWLNRGDAVKSENPFARDLIISTSKGQTAWNFGSWEQKTSPEVWQHIVRHITDQLLPPVPILGHWLVPLLLVAGGAASPRRIPLILIFLAGFAAGPVIFTNLYFEHNYYWVANGVWLLLALGVALAGIAECDAKSRWPVPVAASLGAVVCIAGFAAWQQKFLPILQNLPTREKLAEVWIKPVQDSVPPDRTILILGNDWNPNSLYYAERKGIAFPTADWIPLPGPQLDESLKNLGPDEKLGAVVVNEQLLNSGNQAFFRDFLNRLGMSQNGKRTAFGILFPASDLAAPN
jgi:4-amino-4-deoxy-L-arabinose transferase-like glycosyltransferase